MMRKKVQPLRSSKKTSRISTPPTNSPFFGKYNTTTRQKIKWALFRTNTTRRAKAFIASFSVLVFLGIVAWGGVKIYDLAITKFDLNSYFPGLFPRSLESAEAATSFTKTGSKSYTPNNPKKGVVLRKYNAKSNCSEQHATAVQKLNVQWVYDYSSTPKCGMWGVGVVPMIWGATNETSGAKYEKTKAQIREKTEEIAKAGKAGQYRDVLGFNEPDKTNQANLTPQRAADWWKFYIAPLNQSGLRRGSPAVAQVAANSSSQAWFSDFMNQVGCTQQSTKPKNCSVDFIATHAYQAWNTVDPQTNANNLKKALDTIHAKWPYLKIWITETGTVNRAGEMTAGKARSYMAAEMAMLNKLPYIERYAWVFDYSMDIDLGNGAFTYTSLYNTHGDMTELGKLYRTL